MYAASWRIVRFRTDRVTKTGQSWSISYLWQEQAWRSPLRPRLYDHIASWTTEGIPVD
jgi:hypothetical protein